MAAPVSAHAAARRMCERSGWQLTNLHLQKMLYLAQMMYLGRHGGEPLMSGTFEAWDYGPVLPSVYGEAKSYGSRPITYLMSFGHVPDGDRADILDEATDDLARIPAGQLVNITHWKDGAWAKHYVPHKRGIIIPNEDILDEFRRRFPQG